MINVPNRDVFEEVRKHKDSSDKYQAENYSVLGAIDDIIRSAKGQAEYIASPVEYFSCIMSSLTGNTERQRSVGVWNVCKRSCCIFFNSCFPPCRRA